MNDFALILLLLIFLICGSACICAVMLSSWISQEEEKLRKQEEPCQEDLKN